MTFDYLQHLTVELDREVALLTLRASSYEANSLVAIAHAVGALDTHDDVRAIVLRGPGNAFCTGASVALLDHMSNLDREDGVRLVRHGQDNVRALLRSPKLIAAYIDGLAAGGGVDLLLASDLVIVGPEARVNLFYSKLGVVPDQGALYLLAERLGWPRALQLAENSETWGPEECMRLEIAHKQHAGSGAPDFPKLLRRELRVPATTRAALKRLRWDDLAPRLERHLQQVSGEMIDLLKRDEQRALIDRVRAMQRVQSQSAGSNG